MKIKIATYNIWSGRDYYTEGHPVCTDNIAKFIYEKDIAICGLNEVDAYCKRSDYVHEPEEIVKELERLSGKKYYWAMGIGLDGYHQEGSKYGNALISKYPIVKAEDIKIFGKYVEDPENPKSQIQEKRERRSLIIAEIDVEGKPLTALITHFDLYRDTQQAAVDEVKARFAEIQTPVFLSGDLNVDEDDNITVQLEETFVRAGKDDPTGTFRDGSKIDFIYHSPDVSSEDYCVHKDVTSSDHFPVSVVIEF